MGSVQIRAIGVRAGSDAHTSAERGKVSQGEIGEYFTPGPQHCLSEGIHSHP